MGREKKTRDSKNNARAGIGQFAVLVHKVSNVPDSILIISAFPHIVGEALVDVSDYRRRKRKGNMILNKTSETRMKNATTTDTSASPVNNPGFIREIFCAEIRRVLLLWIRAEIPSHTSVP